MRVADRIVDAVLAAVIGGLVRAVLAGAALLYAVGCWLGWGWVAAIVAVAVAYVVWCALQLRPWRSR